MPTHAEKRILPYTQRELFDLVAGVERYPEFLPWCLAARVRSHEGNVLTADLVIGFKMIRERFTSRVTLSPPDRVDVAYTHGPLRYLNNHWIFERQPPTPVCPAGGTLIDFYVDFEFHSRLMQTMMGVLFNEAVKRMVRAFEARAHALYGPRPAPERQPERA
ncbi:MAG: type II toxin-antitoxin system RatA family toxin [Pseudomonadota bacterium]